MHHVLSLIGSPVASQLPKYPGNYLPTYAQYLPYKWRDGNLRVFLPNPLQGAPSLAAFLTSHQKTPPKIQRLIQQPQPPSPFSFLPLPRRHF